MQSSTYKLHVCIPEQCLLGERTWVSLSVSQLSHLSARDVHSKRSSGNCLEDQTNSSSEANRTNLAYSEFMPRKWTNYRGRTTAQVALVLTETSESNLENNEGTERLLHSQRGAGKSGVGVLGIQGWIWGPREWYRTASNHPPHRRKVRPQRPCVSLLEPWTRNTFKGYFNPPKVSQR